MNIFDLSRHFWNYAFDNPQKIKTNHMAMYFFIIDKCNRLGWKKNMGFPTTDSMECLGIKSYKTFINTLNDLVDAGFIKIVEKSRHRHSSTIISISNATPKSNSSLDKANYFGKNVQSNAEVTTKVDSKYVQSNYQSKDQSNHSIDIHNTRDIKQYNNSVVVPPKSFKQLTKEEFYDKVKVFSEKYSSETCKEFFKYWTEPSPSGKMRFQLEKTWETERRLQTWKRNEDKFGTAKKPVGGKNGGYIPGPWN